MRQFTCCLARIYEDLVLKALPRFAPMGSELASGGELASDWESDLLLRNRARSKGILTSWPDSKSTGVPSMKAAVLNARAVELATLWWARKREQPEAIRIDDIRAEARFSNMFIPKLYIETSLKLK